MSEEDTSSSSSSSEEEEETSSTTAPTAPQQTENRISKFECPDDFVSFSYKPCCSTLSSDSGTELWLIKAPASFQPQSFSGVQLPLSSLGTVSVASEDGTVRPYSVLGSSSCSPELRLLAPNTTLAPPFSGLLSICESHGNYGADQALHVVPAIPPPSLPTGLKQRFQHFQATTVCTQRNEGGSPKKRKKEKKIKIEPQETSERVEATPTDVVIKTEVKHEPLDTGFDEPPKAKKKKKKKKSESVA